MTETLLMLYTMFAAAGTFALLSLLGAVELRARRQRSRDAALRAKYLRIVMLYLLAGEGPAPRFPMIRRAGARLLLVETVAGLAGVTYGLDAAPLRRIVAEYGLDAWLLRRTARSRGYRRARCLLLLSRLPVGAAAADCAARYAASRNRYVRFQSLMVLWEIPVFSENSFCVMLFRRISSKIFSLITLSCVLSFFCPCITEFLRLPCRLKFMLHTAHNLCNFFIRIFHIPNECSKFISAQPEYNILFFKTVFQHLCQLL